MTAHYSDLTRFEPFWSDLELSHRDMDRRHALKCHEALLSAIPRKVAYLHQVLRECHVHLVGEPRLDFRAAATWLGRNARERPYTEEEIRRERGRFADAPPHIREIIDQGEWRKLDEPTMSMCHYVGYFFSELLRRECPDAKYVLRKDKRFIDYNLTVLVGKGRGAELEPVRVMSVIASECVDNNGSPKRDLAELYDIWKSDMLGEV